MPLHSLVTQSKVIALLLVESEANQAAQVPFKKETYQVKFLGT